MTPRAAGPVVMAMLALALAACGNEGAAAPPVTSTSSPVSSAVSSAAAKPGRAAAPPPSNSAATTTTAVTAPAATTPPSPPSTAAPIDTVATTPYTVVAHQPAGLDQLPERAVVAPVRVRVDGHDIDALVVPVSADPAGELAVPPSPDVVAWYQHGAGPGEDGTVALAAHVAWDGAKGPFFTLDTVPAGASVMVTLGDGSELTYTVTRMEQVAKADLPRDEIFARDGPSRLALVTCGGEFDRDRHRYVDNIVVLADLVTA